MVRSKNKRKKNNDENNINISVVEQNTAIKIQTLPESEESKKLDSLFEKVKAKVEALKAAGTPNAHNIPFHDISASTHKKAYPLEKTIKNGELDCVRDLLNVSQRAAEVTAPTDPLIVRNRLQKLEDIKNKKKMKKKKKKKTTEIKIQTLLEQSNNISLTVGCCPTSVDPIKESLVRELPEYKNKKKMKKKKKKTTDIKMQTLLEQSDNISPIVGSCPTSFDPVKESLVQELPEYEKKRTTDIKIQTPLEQSDNISPIVGCIPTSVDPVKESVIEELPEYKKKKKMKKKKKKKTTDIKIQTFLEQSDNISPIVGYCPTCFNPIKESFVQELPGYENTKFESLPKKQDPISKKDLEKSLEEVKVNTEALEAAGNTNARNIPFHDMSATTPDKAYPLEKIIEKEEWDCLGDLLNFSQVAKLTPDAYPIFVCNRVQKLEDIKDEHHKSTVAGVLQYITHLIKYKDKHSMGDYKSVKNHKFPSILEEKFRTMFNESSSKSLSVEKRKFLINYVLVLTLFVDGYQSDASDIAKDLRTDVAELKKQYEQLGCKIVHEKSVLLATLTVPLKFPVFRKRTGKKRKRQSELGSFLRPVSFDTAT